MLKMLNRYFKDNPRVTIESTPPMPGLSPIYFVMVDGEHLADVDEEKTLIRTHQEIMKVVKGNL